MPDPNESLKNRNGMKRIFALLLALGALCTLSARTLKCSYRVTVAGSRPECPVVIRDVPGWARSAVVSSEGSRQIPSQLDERLGELVFVADISGARDFRVVYSSEPDKRVFKSRVHAQMWLKNPDKRLILQPMTQDVYLREYLAKHNTQIMSWGPFAEGKNDFFNTPVLKEIGAKYGKSVAQVALRFLLQNGVVVIPKSTHEERMQENFNVFDFVLTDEEMKQMEVLDTGKSLFFSHYSPETVEWFMSIV